MNTNRLTCLPQLRWLQFFLKLYSFCPIDKLYEDKIFIKRTTCNYYHVITQYGDIGNENLNSKTVPF